jgi:polysaccharide biosynthesis/export protein
MYQVKSDFLALALAAAVISIACAAAGGQTTSQPARLRSAEPPNPASPGLEPVGAAVDPNKYLIGPEDILFIKVWRENDFTLPVAVRPDGKITMPLIGEVAAAERTPMQLTSALTELLSKYMNKSGCSGICHRCPQQKILHHRRSQPRGLVPAGHAHHGS